MRDVSLAIFLIRDSIADSTINIDISHFGIFQYGIYPGQNHPYKYALMAKKLTKEKLIAALVQMRKNSGLTQQQLAERLGKPQSFVSKYEIGERSLDFIEVIETIELLGLDPVIEIKKMLGG